MSDDLSPVLALPLLQAAQAQKHVTHNEALRLLDILVQPAVASRTTAVPPAFPLAGDRHIVPPGATGAWAGQDRAIAYYEDPAGWSFLAPLPGWQAHVLDEHRLAMFDGTAWITQADQAQRFPRLGVGTDADATSRLAVAAPASLFSHAGAGHQMKINKAAAADTASLLFQTGWAGRAELGTAGSDVFSVKVSADGSSWTTALSLAPATGLAGGSAITQSATDATPGRLMKVGDFGLGISGNAPLLASLDATDTPAGLHRVTPTGTGGTFPAGANGFASLLVTRYAADSLQQEYAEVLSPRRWRRNYRGASTPQWSSWRLMYDQGSVLGSVSQTGGLPTGALVETGSNANGRYTRWADGTQICTHAPVTSAAAGTVWTFPAAFADTTARRVLALPVASVLCGAVLDGTPGTTDAILSVRGASDARLAVTVHVTAIGRWF
ncbi:DUF2793 domain-containing protein [Gemmobacter sp.]|uniref:DUF2793 domain-containing protein n=1 Tax=Gemmobacter sp. TaxID=1898957 RepID=UPI002AFE28D0|nr:DUF2793 domain-containing protein [Gemmobacter sp.]